MESNTTNEMMTTTDNVSTDSGETNNQKIESQSAEHIFHINELKETDVRPTQILAAYCFAVVHKYLHNAQPPAIPDALREFHKADVRIPLFITWMTKLHSGNFDSYDRLRGCIGCLKPLPIMEIETYAIKSAFKDPRFSPISEAELEHLECKVQFLCQYEKCQDPYDWDLETHGLIISFTRNDNTYASTYLPGIAFENSFSKEETITNLIRKAKWEGTIPDDLIESLSVVRYQSAKTDLTYIEYKKIYHDTFFVPMN